MDVDDGEQESTPQRVEKKMKVLTAVPAGFKNGKGRGKVRSKELLSIYARLEKDGRLDGVTAETVTHSGYKKRILRYEGIIIDKFLGWVKTDTHGGARLVSGSDPSGRLSLFVVPAAAQ